LEEKAKHYLTYYETLERYYSTNKIYCCKNLYNATVGDLKETSFDKIPH
jgi:hypothetical protein